MAAFLILSSINSQLSWLRGWRKIRMSLRHRERKGWWEGGVGERGGNGSGRKGAESAVQTKARRHTYTHTHRDVRTRAHTHTHTHTHIHTYAHAHTHTHTHTHTGTHTHAQSCTHRHNDTDTHTNALISLDEQCTKRLCETLCCRAHHYRALTRPPQ